MEEIKEALIAGDHDKVASLTEEAMSSGSPAVDILDSGLLPGMQVIGERFRKHEIFLPNVLLAARAMNAGLDLIKPELEASQDRSRNRGTVVIGTVEGDLHDIGKNLVCILLRGAGFEVVDLGNNVAPAAFVDAARENQAQVVGMSALLTTTMPAMTQVVASLREAGLSDVKTIVGGAPLSDAYAQQIGADGYGYDAAKAAEILTEWLS